eukprot:1192574-Prorocentrum_minimum.AAC.3
MAGSDTSFWCSPPRSSALVTPVASARCTRATNAAAGFVYPLTRVIYPSLARVIYPLARVIYPRTYACDLPATCACDLPATCACDLPATCACDLPATCACDLPATCACELPTTCACDLPAHLRIGPRLLRQAHFSELFDRPVGRSDRKSKRDVRVRFAGTALTGACAANQVEAGDCAGGGVHEREERAFAVRVVRRRPVGGGLPSVLRHPRPPHRPRRHQVRLIGPS